MHPYHVALLPPLQKEQLLGRQQQRKTFTTTTVRPRTEKKRSREEELILRYSPWSSSSRSFIPPPPSSSHRERGRFIFVRTRVVNSIRFQDSWDWIWFDLICGLLRKYRDELHFHNHYVFVQFSSYVRVNPPWRGRCRGLVRCDVPIIIIHFWKVLLLLFMILIIYDLHNACCLMKGPR